MTYEEPLSIGAITTALEIHGYESGVDRLGRVWVVTEWRDGLGDGSSSDLLPLWAESKTGMLAWLGY